MPSVRVKKGYLSIDDAQNNGRPRSQSLVSLFRTNQPQEEHEFTLRRTRSRLSDGAIDDAVVRRPLGRPRSSSRVSDHILSSARQSPQLPPARPPIAAVGPPRLSDIQENARTHSFSRRRADSYTVEGQQAELRVPIEEGHERASSSISIALEQLDHDQEREDSLEEHHPDDIVEHLDVIGTLHPCWNQETLLKLSIPRPTNFYCIYPY